MTKARPTLAAWLGEAPFTLAMSSGFFGFFAHAGVLTALLEKGLKPAATRGSSAGALVTGLWAAGLEPDVMARELMRLKRRDFWDPRPGFGLLAGRLFDQKLRELLPVPTFESCRAPARVSVFDVWSRRTEVLAQGDLAAAVRASCALPGMFHPVWIDKRPKLDGGIADRPGIHGATPGERILHHNLTSKSPWRRFYRPGQGRPDARPGLTLLAIEDLPRVSPMALPRGKDAYAKAYREAAAALARPVPSRI